jgi:hypothetical protein
VIGLLLASIAAIWHAFLMTAATNDNFLHMTLAKQWLAGEWPVRDFFDHGWVLQYGLSAGAQLIGGDRLMSEAVIIAVAWAISTYLVYQIVLRLTEQVPAAVLAASLPIMAGARGYSYPKGVVYAVAASLWWEYVRKPTVAKIVGFGSWAAIAFYWRPDHGIYVALALALAALAAHGRELLLTITRCSIAAVTMVALLVPFFLYVQLTVGLMEYAQTGLAAVKNEHVTQGPHAWPVLRLWGNISAIEPAEQYAPTIGIRWSTASSSAQRQEVRARYDLTPVESDEDSVERVRVSVRSLASLRGLVNEPIVDDTAGVERSSGTLAAPWSTWQRWKFSHPWLRLRFLPSLDALARAAEISVAVFYALPILLIIAAAWVRTSLIPWVTTQQLIAFACFALLVDAAMLRIPFPARAADAVVLSAITFGLCVAWMFRAVGVIAWINPSPHVTAGVHTRLARGGLALCATVLALVTMLNVATLGRFPERLSGLAGGWTSFAAAQRAWSAVYEELTASPPLAYFVDERARFSLRLAAYVRDCVPTTQRLLVLWFEPEIYYYSDRLMAQRHLGFAPALAPLAHEQRMTLDKIVRFSPPIALARRSALDEYARASYPSVIDYVEREYRLASTVVEEGEDYLIFVRRDRQVLRTFGSGGWPCFVAQPSLWSRAGQPKS